MWASKVSTGAISQLTGVLKHRRRRQRGLEGGWRGCAAVSPNCARDGIGSATRRADLFQGRRRRESMQSGIGRYEVCTYGHGVVYVCTMSQKHRVRSSWHRPTQWPGIGLDDKIRWGVRPGKRHGGRGQRTTETTRGDLADVVAGVARILGPTKACSCTSSC